jgi:hypothetical protein
LGDKDVDGKLILKWIFNKEEMRMWMIFDQLMTESSGRLL